MAKYVCDFAAVKKAGQNIATAGENMTSSVTTYSSAIEANTAGWDSITKDSYVAVNETEVANMNAAATSVSEFGKFIEDAAKKIEELDNSLASSIQID